MHIENEIRNTELKYGFVVFREIWSIQTNSLGDITKLSNQPTISVSHYDMYNSKRNQALNVVAKKT